MKYKKTMMIILIAIIVLSVALIASLLIYFGGNSSETYTWEEFEAMTPEEQMEFQNSFKNEEAFEKWMLEAQKEAISIPWENGGKAPSEYTWEEFEALTAEQQILFQNAFDSFEDFEKWMEEVQTVKVDLPWENGGKEPSEYTWEEFEALTAEQQMMFQNSFKNMEKFDDWLKKANSDMEQVDEEIHSVSWSKPLEEYTWEEFEAMTSAEQIAFQNGFESQEDFENWMESATNPEENDVSFNKNDLFSVTWEEFEAMTGEEQMIFQNSFESIEEFDKWLQANEPK